MVALRQVAVSIALVVDYVALALVLDEGTPRWSACPSWRDNARRHDRRWAHIGPSDVAILEFVAD